MRWSFLSGGDEGARLTPSETVLFHYALSFLGKPYIWGADGHEAFDCSGLVQEILRAAGVDPPGDQTAQALYEHFFMAGDYGVPSFGALAFYGPNARSIGHVAFCLTDRLMIEAGGGGRLTTTPQPGAFVRVRPILGRKDYFAAILPRY